MKRNIDLVWDEYAENRLKATTRRMRGSGVRQRVAPDKKLPRSWKEQTRIVWISCAVRNIS